MGRLLRCPPACPLKTPRFLRSMITPECDFLIQEQISNPPMVSLKFSMLQWQKHDLGSGDISPNGESAFN